MKRVDPTPEQLDTMLRVHLSFEVNRFRLGVRLWGSNRHEEQICLDAMIRESCLVHMRLLLDFFFPRPGSKRPDSRYVDILIDHYFPKRELLSPRFRKLLNEPKWLQDYRDTLDWSLAHLTMRRMDFVFGRPAWDPDEQFRYLNRLIDEFLQALPAERRALYDPKTGLEGWNG